VFGRETRETALRLLEGGMTPNEASAAMGGVPTGRTVRRWREEAARGPRPRKKTLRLSDAEKAAAVRRVLAGEAPRAVAEDVGACVESVRNWARAAAPGGEARAVREGRAGGLPGDPGGGLPDDPEELKAMVRELRFQVDLRDALLDVLKKDPGADLSALSNRERAELVGALRPAYSLSFLTARAGIAPSSYHYWAARLGEARDPDADIRAEVVRLFGESGSTWGYRRIKAEMDAGGEFAGASEKRVRRVMREEGLRPAYDGRRRRSYDSYDRAADEADPDRPPNAPLRADGTHDFSAPAPNVLWVTDVTEFALPDDPRKVYLSAVVDCFEGSAPGWEVALSAASGELTDPSLEAACAQLREGDAPTVHSDGGKQYHAASWRAICAAHGVSRSMSRKGRSPDNARMEGFFGTLKNERFHHRDWSGWTAEDFCAEVDRWMREHNESRKKLSLGWKTPAEYRRAALAERA